MSGYDLHEKAVSIVHDAGGELVGRTRLQKVAYLCQLAGFSADFPFEYRHFGPFSEELADAMQIAIGLKRVREDERRTNWGAVAICVGIDFGAISSMTRLPDHAARSIV